MVDVVDAKATAFSQKANLPESTQKEEAMKRCVLIHIPKTGGTSVKRAIGAKLITRRKALKNLKLPNTGAICFQHMDYAGLVADGRIPRSYDEGAYKFTFVREPYERILSLFVHLRDNTVRLREWSDTWVKFCRTLRKDGVPEIGEWNVWGLSQANPQVRWTERIDDITIGRFETLQADYARIREDIGGGDEQLPHLQRRSRTPAETRKQQELALVFPEYCEETRDIVREFYREDFKAFGYPEE